jgi:hypothetical protein
MSWQFIVSGSGLQNKNCSMMSPLQTNLLNVRSWALSVMSVDSSKLIAKKSASLMLTITRYTMFRDMFCIRRLTVLSERDFQNLFSYDSPNKIFTVLQHSGKISDSTIVCDFIFLCHDFSIGISRFLSLSDVVVILVHSIAWCVWSAVGKM